ncbi:MAG: carbon-nitrogen hydrolase family protein [Pseudomonadota bacterium]
MALGRRKLSNAALGGIASAIVRTARAETPATIALLHLSPQAGRVEHNKRLIEGAARRAAAAGARLIATPELAVSGYGFRDLVGTDWIARDQPELLRWAAALCRETAAALLLGMPEAADDKLFNSMVLFGADGLRIGHHRKINALRVGSESWSTAGDRATVLAIDGIGRAGLFVCADMYSERLVSETAAQGVDLIVSAAAWAPGLHGPDGEWERASRQTARPVLVCNRTGIDVLDFREARSVAAVDGLQRHHHSAPDAAIVLVDWEPGTRTLANWRIA